MRDPTRARPKPPPETPRGAAADQSLWALQHVRFGWWSLLLYSSLGLVLETFHGLKLGWYLDVVNETRRLMWTLAHAHGTLLALVHIALGSSGPWLAGSDARARQLASVGLYAASVTLPAGFFLAGLKIYSGDPGLGIVLVPIGGLLLVFAVAAVAWGLRK